MFACVIVAETLCSSCTKAFMCCSCQKAFGSCVILAELYIQTLQCVETHSVGVSPRLLPESCLQPGSGSGTQDSEQCPALQHQASFTVHPGAFPQQDLQSWLIQPQLCTC